MIVCALLSALLGALLIYLAHPRQCLRVGTAPAWVRQVGAAVLVAGALAWVDVLGTAAGLSAALTTMMAAWVALPYVAWRYGRRADAKAIRR